MSVSFNRGKRTKVSERVCHAMLVVREASSFVPDIGTADTNDKLRSTESSPKWHEQRTGATCECLCREFLVLFAVKKHIEKDLKQNKRHKC